MVHEEQTRFEVHAAKCDLIESHIQLSLERVGGVLTQTRKQRLLEMNVGELELLASRVAMSPSAADAIFLMTAAIMDSERRRRMVEALEADESDCDPSQFESP